MRRAKFILCAAATLAWLALSIRLWWAYPTLHPRLVLPDIEAAQQEDHWVGCRLSKFSPDGRFLAVYRGQGPTVQLWDVHTGKEHIRFAVDGLYNRIDFSPDSQFIIARAPGRFVVRRSSDGSVVYAIQGEIVPYRFAPDGKLFAGKWQPGGDLKLWETATGKEVAVLKKGGKLAEGQRDYQPDFRFAPDSSVLAFAETETRIALWDVSARKKTATVSGAFWSLAFSPDGHLFAVPCDKEIVLQDSKSGNRLGAIPTGDGKVQAIAISPNTDRLAFFWREDHGLELQLWDIASAKRLDSLNGFFNSGNLSFSPDGRMVAVRSNWTMDGSTLVSANSDGLEVVWAGALRMGSSFERPDNDRNFALFNHGRQVATKEMCRVKAGDLGLSVPTAGPCKWEEWHKYLVDFVLGKPDEKGLHSVSFFDVASRSEYASVSDAAYWLLSPDGKTLATQGYVDKDFNLGPVLLWDVPTFTPLYVKVLYSLLPPFLLMAVVFRSAFRFVPVLWKRGRGCRTS